jgi:uridine kinase
MLGDILLITEKHKKAAAEILKHVLADRKERMIIGISGESGSGKTELAHTLAKMLRTTENITAKPLHTDNFYKTHPLERRQWRVKHGIENVVGYNEYDWAAIDNTIEAFKKGEVCEMPCVDLVTEQVDRLITNFGEVQMLIVDGLYAIKAKEMHLRIFIELTYLETKEKHTKDARGKEVMDEVRWATLKREHEMVQSLRPTADLLINRNYEVVKA